MSPLAKGKWVFRVYGTPTAHLTNIHNLLAALEHEYGHIKQWEWGTYTFESDLINSTKTSEHLQNYLTFRLYERARAEMDAIKWGQNKKQGGYFYKATKGWQTVYGDNYYNDSLGKFNRAKKALKL